MKTLFTLNGPPYGDERNYNALRLALALHKTEPECDVVIFLMADAVMCAKADQKTPEGYYNLERMLRRVMAGKARLLLCGTCMDARGLGDDDILAGAQRSTMDDLARETLSSDKVLVF